MKHLSVLVLLVACSSSTPTVVDSQPAADPKAQAASDKPVREAGDVNPRLLRRFKPVRKDLGEADALQPARVALGKMLFFDKRLSEAHDLACNSCHKLDEYGVDHEATSPGAKGQRGRRNSPTVYHAAGHFTSFWDGRAPSVEEQAKGPILNPVEMAMPSGDAVVERLAAVPGYVTAFQAAFPGDPKPVTYDHVGVAIGAFERELVTPSRWDRYLAGDKTALSAGEVAGFKLFTDLGCMTCHTGEFVGGSMFQKVGAMKPWPNQADQGRFEVTNLPSDKMLFKVPSLRNVAKTGPYFHDGSAKTLEEAVAMMARHQLGEELSAEDVASIVTWLGSLTGELPAEMIAPPTLP